MCTYLIINYLQFFIAAYKLIYQTKIRNMYNINVIIIIRKDQGNHSPSGKV